RVEDDRLLRGRGHFTDDIDEGALESVLVRSPFAHARIKSIDVSAARAVPGVKAVYVAADLPFGHTDLPILIPHPNLAHGRTQRCLASEVVRYTGEAVAFVVAENRYLAEDAADLVQVEYEPLPVVITPEVAAVAEHLVHADVPGNVAAEMLQEAGDVKPALAAAPHRKQLHLRFERGAASPMEGRAVWARWSEAEHRLTVFDSTQSPTSIRGGLAVLFGLPESDVDVIAPDVGGGFGPKIMLFYPDELLVPFAAMQLGRPVKWTEDRQEHFTAVNQERGQVHEVEVGFDGDGHVLALDVDFIHDGGAYTPYGIILPIITAAQVPGPYRVPNYRVRFRDVYTNAIPTSPYRGAGKVVAFTGIPNQGQAHATVWAQIVADQLGVDVSDVEVSSGDTRRFKWGVGTFASRAAIMAGNAMAVAAGMVADKAKHIAAEHLEADPADLELAGGSVRVKGSPDRGMPLAAVAVLSNPMRYAVGGGTGAATQFTPKARPGPPLLEGEQPGLEATGYFSPVGSAWAAGCHAAYVRVDPKSYRLEILKYVVVHDCGRLINPLVVEGQ